MSVYLRGEVDLNCKRRRNRSLIRKSINKVAVTSLKDRKQLNIIERCVWFACGVRCCLGWV